MARSTCNKRPHSCIAFGHLADPTPPATCQQITLTLADTWYKNEYMGNGVICEPYFVWSSGTLTYYGPTKHFVFAGSSQCSLDNNAGYVYYGLSLNGNDPVAAGISRYDLNDYRKDELLPFSITAVIENLKYGDSIEVWHKHDVAAGKVLSLYNLNITLYSEVC